jgi:hypothetical protein
VAPIKKVPGGQLASQVNIPPVMEIKGVLLGQGFVVEKQRPGIKPFASVCSYPLRHVDVQVRLSEVELGKIKYRPVHNVPSKLGRHFPKGLDCPSV